MIVFSADPGTKNFGACVAEHTFVKGKMRSNIIGTGMITSTFTDMKGSIVEDMRIFEQDLVYIKNTYKPDIVFFERFQSRGLKGTTIECINMMLAIMVRVFRHKDPRLYLASTWKNRINKQVDLKDTYKSYGMSRKASPKTPHELDATLIGYYGMCRHLDIQDFSMFNEDNWDNFMEWFMGRPLLEFPNSK